MTQSLKSSHFDAWYNTSAAAAWGLITFDWGNSRQAWQNVHPHNNEELLTEQCRRVKALGTGTCCMVYRQNELSVQVRASRARPKMKAFFEGPDSCILTLFCIQLAKANYLRCIGKIGNPQPNKMA